MTTPLCPLRFNLGESEMEKRCLKERCAWYSLGSDYKGKMVGICSIKAFIMR